MPNVILKTNCCQGEYSTSQLDAKLIHITIMNEEIIATAGAEIYSNKHLELQR